MKKHVTKIAGLVDLDIKLRDCTPELVMLSLAEESGELAVAIKVARGRKKKKLSEPAYSEAVDIIICGFTLYCITGGCPTKFEAVFNKKLAKWVKNFNKYKNKLDKKPTSGSIPSVVKRKTR